MITGLDHVVVLVRDINVASAAYQTLLARAPSWQYSGGGADRVLFTLDNTTIELVAPSGEDDNAQRIRSILDAQGEGLASICFRTDDIAKMHRNLPTRIHRLRRSFVFKSPHHQHRSTLQRSQRA